jgi:predicted transposase YbfD/YdcC
VKRNQPTLLSDLKAEFASLDADWKRGGEKIPPYLAREWKEQGVEFDQSRDVSKGHGRTEERELWAVSDPEVNRSAGTDGTVGASWPGLRQILRLRRERTVKGVTRPETTYLITSLPSGEADAKTLLALVRSYWGIENRLHWVRDVTFGEDRSQVRTGSAPQVKAALTNLTITLLRRSGVSNLAAALRTFSARSLQAINFVLSAHLLL